MNNDSIVCQTSPEFKIELVPCFHKFTRFPVKADWYEVKLSTGGASMIIPLDIFKRFDKVVQELVQKEER